MDINPGVVNVEPISSFRKDRPNLHLAIHVQEGLRVRLPEFQPREAKRQPDHRSDVVALSELRDCAVLPRESCVFHPLPARR